MSRKENQVFRQRAKRSGTLTPAKAELLEQNLLEEEEAKKGSLGQGKAKELDMDHIFVKFTDFL